MVQRTNNSTKTHARKTQKASPIIGTLNEKHLHSALKEWYAKADDRFEIPVDGFLVDIVRSKLLIEIQARNFSAIKRKLNTLATDHPVRLVYPIVQEKWIVKLAKDKTGQQTRRKSPKKGNLEHVFEELVSFPRLLLNPNFSLEVLLVHEEEVRKHRITRRWRQKEWITQERRLLKVVGQRLFETPEDFAALIPSTLTEPFTTSGLAVIINKPVRIAQKMAYCLREMGVITSVGKRRNAVLYNRNTTYFF